MHDSKKLTLSCVDVIVLGAEAARRGKQYNTGKGQFNWVLKDGRLTSLPGQQAGVRTF